MAKNLYVPLDTETFDRLQTMAIAERRPVKWQASVLLRQAVGLSVPSDLQARLGNLKTWLDSPEEEEPTQP